MSFEPLPPLDYVTLPCGFGVPDMASLRNIAILKAEPNWCGLDSFKEWGYAVRYEIAEHAEHSAGQCAGKSRHGATVTGSTPTAISNLKSEKMAALPPSCSVAPPSTKCQQSLCKSMAEVKVVGWTRIESPFTRRSAGALCLEVYLCKSCAELQGGVQTPLGALNAT